MTDKQQTGCRDCAVVCRRSAAGLRECSSAAEHRPASSRAVRAGSESALGRRWRPAEDRCRRSRGGGGGEGRRRETWRQVRCRRTRRSRQPEPNSREVRPTPFSFTTHQLTLQSTRMHTVTHTHTRTRAFNGPLSGTTHVSRYQKGKNRCGFY